MNFDKFASIFEIKTKFIAWDVRKDHIVFTVFHLSSANQGKRRAEAGALLPVV
jgi:hypothetical protein